jgi:uncharacterized iron-regulated membrane protein
VFFLMLCVTGLPLIFHHEIEEALGHEAPLPDVPAGTVTPPIDEIVTKALSARPGEVVRTLFFQEDRPVVIVYTAEKLSSGKNHSQFYDLRTGALVPPPPAEEGTFMWFMYELHTDLFLGNNGMFFLGAMGVLMLAAIVSGIVVYAPFMRRIDFGTVRTDMSRRLKWLDLHNFLGIATVAWLLVVTFTGVFNTLDPLLAIQFRDGQLKDMTAPYKGAPPLQRLGSVDVAVATALKASPGMEVSSVEFPGTFFGTPHHYNVFMRGATPVSKRLIKPTLVDAQTGALTDTRDMPLHIRALFLSRPLHFGDYGGLAMKIVWAVFDLVAIFVLISGLYLWFARRGAQDRRFEAVEAEAVQGPA